MRFSNRLWLSAALPLVLAVCGSDRAFGDAISFTSAPTDWNDGSPDRILGWDFTPNQDLVVTALGFYDLGNLPNGLATDHQVAMFRTSDQVQVIPTYIVAAGCAGTNYFCYVSIDPVSLTAGTNYTIAGSWPRFTADGFTWTWVGNPGNSLVDVSVDPAITLGTGHYLTSTAAMTFPQNPDPRPFFGPNFQFGETATPEPASWGLLLVGGVFGFALWQTRLSPTAVRLRISSDRRSGRQSES